MDILKRAADLLQNSAEEFESPDGLSVCVGIDAWNEFFEALDSELDRMARSEPRAVLMAAMRDAVSDMKAGAFLADCGTDIAFRSVNYAAIADRYASQVAQDGPVNRQLLAETVALLERHQKWLNKLPVPTAGATYQMMTDSPNLSYKVPLRCGDVNLFKSAFKQYEETLVSQGWTVVYTEVHWTEGNIAILVS